MALMRIKLVVILLSVKLSPSNMKYNGIHNRDKISTFYFPLIPSYW
jgi:hypothetical protein